ncbi:phage antirepressor KilAC domain-containing protein [Streptomyces sp. NPDC060322]|uniref:phage antirepressor KilAC domain-containing protein n=1 Tax=Streptomyces sp. NPDC060322 TaxID=3347097 RepID=UPI00365C84AA
MSSDTNLIAPGAGNESGGASPFDSIMLLDHNGEERWSARDLQVLMGYEEWRKFDDTVTRAAAAIEASGMDALDHIVGAAKVMNSGRWGRQQVKDYRLTRFGAYHVALAGDGRKPEVAMAKTYFAVRTREAELAAPAPTVPDSPEAHLALAQNYLAAATELVATKKELAIAAPKAGKWDQFCNSDGLIDMNVAAHALSDLTGGLGRTKFMEMLRSDDIHFLQKQNQRLPYQEHERAGRAHVRLVEAPNGKWVEQTFFTPRGLDWLVDRLGGNYLPLPAA